MPEAKKSFGEGLGYLDLSNIKGKLIVLEGTDGVGRSTQIGLLKHWLEVEGYGVVTTGWTRSNLMSKSIELVKKGNMAESRTFSLLYATDFADRFENEIVPALKAGFIVLADRYVFTAWARDAVRSGSMDWIKKVLSFGMIPDLTLYLRIDIANLIPRVIEAGGMNYWESGMDLHLADNIFDCFREYQKRLIEYYDQIAEQEKLEVVDARHEVDIIHEIIKSKVSQLLGIQYKQELDDTLSA